MVLFTQPPGERGTKYVLKLRLSHTKLTVPLSPGGCVKTTKQTRRHFDRREKSPSTTFPKAAVRFL